MGAWGTGTFENDGAADFLAEYEDAGLSVVLEAFEMVEAGRASGYIEVDAGSWGLAATEVIASSNGRPASILDTDIKNSILLHQSDVQTLEKGPEIGLHLISIIAAPEGKSELYDLWEESEVLDEWLSVVRDQYNRLESLTQ